MVLWSFDVLLGWYDQLGFDVLSVFYGLLGLLVLMGYIATLSQSSTVRARINFVITS